MTWKAIILYCPFRLPAMTYSKIIKLFSMHIIRVGIISMIPFFSIIEGNADDTVQFQGNKYPVMEIVPEKNSGINSIFVLYDTNDVAISYSSQSNKVRWLQYNNLGGGYAEEVKDLTVTGNVYTLSATKGDTGYIIYDNDKMYTFWIVDYSKHVYDIEEILIPSDQECDILQLEVRGSASPIHYYSVNGRQETLDRDITLEYKTLEWDNNSLQYIQNNVVKSVAYLNSNLTISPSPYCNTNVTVSGDKFLKYWNMQKQCQSDLYITKSVAVNTMAIQNENNDTEDSSNQIGADVDGLGGSAPCEISFTAYVTDAVIHNEWQISNDIDFEDITHRITEQDFTYTFTDEGVAYIRFIGSNSDGSCVAFGDTYTVTIGSSELRIPNAFSPNDDGVNDVWKVSYRSLLDFECWIFDRNGHQLYHFTNPDDGWDGKHNGKVVKSGAYYYVIKATGSDGKTYKKSGDINIISFKRGSASSTPEN